jgi:hypothetical protein
MPVLEITSKKTLNVGSSKLAEEVKMSRSGPIQTLRDGSLKQFKPKFRDENELSFEERTDPDYRLRQLAQYYRGKLPITCSRCHHCRK